jgi:hypothetical protein
MDSKTSETVEVHLDDITLNYTPTLVFDKHNPNWAASPEYNVVFLRASQNYCNDLYRVRGFLFLNEVYQQLGFPMTGAGAVLGWIFGESENVLVDFEIDPGDGGSINLTFNPLGVIVDQMDER